VLRTFEEFNLNSFKKKQIDPINNKHSDIDPYGEEIWEDEKLIPKEYFYKSFADLISFNEDVITYYLIKIDNNKFLELGMRLPNNILTATPDWNKWSRNKIKNLVKINDDDYEAIKILLSKEYKFKTANSYLKNKIKNYDEINESKNKIDLEKEANRILDKKGKLNKKDKSALMKLRGKFKKDTNLKTFIVNDINKFDKITYNKENSEHYGKTGIVLKIREDGKYVVRFDDGSRLAANPAYLIKEEITKAMKKIDPYNEEDWG